MQYIRENAYFVPVDAVWGESICEAGAFRIVSSQAGRERAGVTHHHGGHQCQLTTSRHPSPKPDNTRVSNSFSRLNNSPTYLCNIFHMRHKGGKVAEISAKPVSYSLYHRRASKVGQRHTYSMAPEKTSSGVRAASRGYQ